MLVDIVDNYINLLNISFLYGCIKVENLVELVFIPMLIRRHIRISTIRKEKSTGFAQVFNNCKWSNVDKYKILSRTQEET